MPQQERRNRTMPNGFRVIDIGEDELRWEFEMPDHHIRRGRIYPSVEGIGWLIEGLYLLTQYLFPSHLQSWHSMEMRRP